MRLLLRPLFLVLVLQSYALADDYDSEKYVKGEFEGVYYSGFEVSNFQPCDSDERWWLESDNSSVWDEIEKHQTEAENVVYKPVFLKVSALINRRKSLALDGMLSGHGHLGMYNREIKVIQVLESRSVTEEDLRRCTVEEDRGYPSERGLPL